MKFARKYADKETRKGTYQAMEALVHNLNTMHSRGGNQVVFSSVNYGTDTSSRVARASTGALAFGQACVVRSRDFACGLRKSRPNRSAFVQTATFQPEWRHSLPNCEVLLRTADLFPNDGVPSRAAWFFVQLRKFLPNGGVLAGLACPLGLAWRTLPRHRRRVQGGKFG